MGYVVNLVLDGRLAVVVGGGEIASRRVHDLLEAKAIVTVVAPEPCGRIRKLADEELVAGHWREYRSSDLYGAHVAIAATDDRALNAQVHRDAQSLGVFVNVVNAPELCNFTVPASVRRGSLTISVATDGRCPALAGVLREELERRYGAEYGELLRLMSELRQQMIGLGWRGARIRAAIRELYEDGIAETIAMRDRRLLGEFIRSRLGGDFEASTASSKR